MKIVFHTVNDLPRTSVVFSEGRTVLSPAIPRDATGSKSN